MCPCRHELLSFTVPLTKIRPADVEDVFHPSCAQLGEPKPQRTSIRVSVGLLAAG